MKDCKLIFAGDIAPYEFESKNLAVALAWAKDKKWDIVAVITPWYSLSVFDHETYKAAMDAFNFSGVPMEEPKKEEPKPAEPAKNLDDPFLNW